MYRQVFDILNLFMNMYQTLNGWGIYGWDRGRNRQWVVLPLANKYTEWRSPAGGVVGLGGLTV